MFALSSLSAITDGTSKFLDPDGVNSRLNNVTGAFAFANSLLFATDIDSDTENKGAVYTWLTENHYDSFILSSSTATGLAEQTVVDFTNNFSNIASKDRAFRNTYSTNAAGDALTACRVPLPYANYLIGGSTSNYYAYIRPANDAQVSYKDIGINAEDALLKDQLGVILKVI
jgi:hypothetical protein